MTTNAQTTLTIPAAHFAAVAMFRAVKDIRHYLNGVMIETGPQGAYIVAVDYECRSKYVILAFPLAITESKD